jgi:very-short-patch-repair endonuclease
MQTDAARERDARLAARERDARLAARERDARLAARERDARLAARERDARLAARERDARLAARERDARLAAHLKRQHGLITRDQAQAAGAARRHIRTRVESGRWERLHRGVYRCTTHPSDPRQAILAACLAAGDGAVARGLCAAALLALDGAPRPDAVEILAPRRVRLTGVDARRTGTLHPGDIACIQGIPVTSAARTLVDLAERLPAPLLARLTDDVLRRKLASLSTIEACLARIGSRGRAAAGRLRRILGDRRPEDAAAESALEQRVLRIIREAGMPEPTPQLGITLGRVRARLDFAYPDRRLAIEVDGFRYHAQRGAHDRDRVKGNALVGAGWDLIRISSTFSDVEIAAVISAALAKPPRVSG